MTDTELAEIEARANAATPGPWRVGHAETWHVFGDVGNPELMAPACGRVLLRANEHYRHGHDMAFIAHARADVPALVAEVRRLRELVARAETWGNIEDWETGYRRSLCPYCGGKCDNDIVPQYATHKPDCPAFSAPGVVR